jgi:hypothetical protein
VVLNCKLDELRGTFATHAFHGAVFVESHGPWRQVEHIRNLFHGFTLGHELNHFALANGGNLGMLS